MNLNNIEKTIYIYYFILIIYSEYLFMRYNKKVILNYIKENYPNEYVTLNMHLHPLIYIFPFIILIVTCYYFQIYHFISTKNAFLIGILLIFMYCGSLVSLSFSLCLTNRRILKIYSISLFKYFGSEINLVYENIDNLKALSAQSTADEYYKYMYDTIYMTIYFSNGDTVKQKLVVSYDDNYNYTIE